jgi:murein DD-endopeptidase MepM/ murein hydrolase activator NlpD
MILCPVQLRVRITQHFGENPDVYEQFDLKGHNGVDIAGGVPGVRVPVLSPYDGVVRLGDQGDRGYGKNIHLFTDPDGDGRIREVVLAHFSYIHKRLKDGDRVYLGDELGMMGNTGFSSGVHLHLGLRYRDPKRNNEIINSNNGYRGFVDFEKYLLYTVDEKLEDRLVTYPYDIM